MRQAIPEDASKLAKVHIDSWRAAYRGLVPDAYLASLDYARQSERFRQSLATNSEETYVTERGGHISGFLTLGACRDADVDQDAIGEIWGIYIAPEYWREGIGCYLCKWGESQLLSRGYSLSVLWVFRDNAQARGFYEAMGFASDGTTKMLNLGKELEVIRYRKELIKSEQSNPEATSNLAPF